MRADASVPGAVTRAYYRVWQVKEALTGRLSGDDRWLVQAVLTPAQQVVFDSMLPRDQRHGVRVCRTLRAWGWEDRDLLVAALLHDVGKGRGVRLWNRVVYVVLAAVAPRLLAQLANVAADSASWRSGLIALRHHAERGADMARRAGCSEATVRLVRLHESGNIPAAADPALAALRAADDAC